MIYYTKQVSKNGKVTYTPVAEYDSQVMDSFPYGSHLVVVKSGSRSIRYNVDPDYATIMAALVTIKDDFVNMLSEASKLKPPLPALSDNEIEAWDNMKKVFGQSLNTLYGPSLNDIAENIMTEILKQSKELLKNPSYKKSWDNLQLIADLIK